MPIASGLLLAAMGGLGLLALRGSGNKGSGTRAGPPGSPEYQYTDDALAGLTEYVNTPQGPVRYFRATFVASILNSLANKGVEVVSKTETSILYRVVSGASNNAVAFVTASANMGYAVFATLNVWAVDSKDVYILTAPMNDRAKLATHGQPWAALLDKERLQAPVVPTTPATPGIPPVPNVIPPHVSLPAMPGPGMPGPGMPGPGMPGPGTTQPALPGVTSSACMGQIDAHMPATTKQLSCAFINNPQSSAEALRMAAQAFTLQGYPLAAAMANSEAAKRGATTPGPVPPVPPTMPAPPVVTVDTPYRIRSGDIPYYLARYYTGDGARTKEILAVNGEMKAVTKDGTTYYQPWNVGSIIRLPASWNVPSKPLSKPATTTASSEPYTVPTGSPTGSTNTAQPTPSGGPPPSITADLGSHKDGVWV